MSWQVDGKGTRMIGHMIFKKNLDSEDKLGLKVIGGQTLSNGRLGAIVEKVKRGSIADQEGHIKPGRLCVSIFHFFIPISAFFFIYLIGSFFSIRNF